MVLKCQLIDLRKYSENCSTPVQKQKNGQILDFIYAVNSFFKNLTSIFDMLVLDEPQVNIFPK